MKPLGIMSVCLCVAAAPWLLAGAANGDPAKGKTVFENCAVCHNADSTEQKMGPGLKGLFKRAKLKSGQKVTEATVRARVDEGGGGMPGYKDMLTDGEKNDLIAYLKTL
jgi:cytochrome c2